jgi:serine/threonine protein kinase
MSELGPGRSVGGFVLERFFDGDGLADFWDARAEDGTPVTLAILPPGLGEEALDVSRRLEAWGRIEHPSVSRFKGSGEDDGRIYAVIERLKGDTISSLLGEAGRIDLERAFPILKDVLLGLSALHEHGVLARGLSARSVIVPRVGPAKIRDLLISELLEEPRERRGMIVGAAPYIAPEHVRGDPIDARADLYSFGVLFYEILTGSPPFGGDTVYEILTAHMNHAPPPLSQALPEADPRLEELIGRLLAKHPEQRPASANEVLQAISEIVLPLASTRPERRAAPSREEKTARPSPLPLIIKSAERTVRALLPPTNMMLGRNESCEIVVSSPLVSRHHAVITFEETIGFRINDVGSLNDTLVNGSRLNGRRHALVEGDAISIGPIVFVVGWAGFTEDPNVLDLSEGGPEQRPWVVAGEDTAPPGIATREGAPQKVVEEEDSPRTYDTGRVFGVDVESIRTPPIEPEIEMDGDASQPIELPRIDGESSLIDASGPVDWPTTMDSKGHPLRARDAAILSPGTMISGRHRVVRHLAQGGFANVYLAEDRASYLEKRIALKIPRSSEDAERLVSELRTQYKWWKVLSDLAPDRFVRLLDIEPIEIRGTRSVGIFMEFMPDGSLLRMVSKGWGGRPKTREQLAEVVRLFVEACSSVQFMHEHDGGFVHRDLKPANMLLSNGRCKLADFELLIRVGRAASKRAVGTVPYMAPESFGGTFTVASDVFSLGASLYHLLHGELPLGRGDLSTRPAIDVLARKNPLVSAELHEILLRCLEPDPNDRPQSAGDLINALGALGLTDRDTNSAPFVLARLLLEHLGGDDIAHVVRTLERRGFRSSRPLLEQRHEDILREYCYSESPREILAQHCTARQVSEMAAALGIEGAAEADRDDLIASLLEAVGFQPGACEIPGIEQARMLVERQLLDLAHATSSDECTGMVQSGLLAVERVVDILVRFFGQLLLDSGLRSFLRRSANGKPLERLTFESASACSESSVSSVRRGGLGRRSITSSSGRSSTPKCSTG